LLEIHLERGGGDGGTPMRVFGRSADTSD
jgi:hypothetical protein